MIWYDNYPACGMILHDTTTYLAYDMIYMIIYYIPGIRYYMILLIPGIWYRYTI